MQGLLWETLEDLAPRPVRFPASDLYAFEPSSRRNLRTLLHVSHIKLQEWDTRGLTLQEAVKVAENLDAHPAEIWPDWFQVILDGAP